MKSTGSKRKLTSNFNQGLSGLADLVFTTFLCMIFSTTLLVEHAAAQDEPFIMTWETEATQNNLIRIPMRGNGYDFTIDWGDGSDPENYTNDPGDGTSHNLDREYADAGVYEIKITGDFPRIYINNGPFRSNAQSVEQWGDIQWQSMERAFAGAENLVVNANDNPNLTNVTNMRDMFRGISEINSDLSGWDVGSVTDMEGVFQNVTSFNGDIGGWNVSNAEVMRNMFRGATSFNRDLSGWDFSSVWTMSSMFNGATGFDQNLGAWNISDGTDMNSTLSSSGLSVESYDNSLIGWATQPIQNIGLGAIGLEYCDGKAARQMLLDTYNWVISNDSESADCEPAGTANPFITIWKSDNPGSSGDTEIVIPTTGSGYNYDLFWEDVNDATNTGTETGATGDLTIDFGAPGTYMIEITGDFPRIYFNNSGDKEKILSVEQWGEIEWSSMASAFSGATELEINASDVPDLSNVTSMSSMFNGAENINSDLSGWDVSAVTNMNSLFKDATAFNGDISTWQTGMVTLMSQMFQGATAFNGNIGNWDVSHVESMSSMFLNAEAFNADISGWDVSSVTNMTSMFGGTTAFNRDINYNSSTGAWNTAGVETMSNMFQGAVLFNGDISGWNVSGVTTMRAMFQGAGSFNGDISGWDVLAVEDFSQMFASALSFNADITGWQTTYAESMQGMFLNALDFNQNLGGWDITSVTDMTSMLNSTSLSLVNYDNTLIGWNGQSVQSNVELGADGLEYCNGKTARDDLSNNFNWTITGDSEAANCDPDAFRPFITTWKSDNPGSSDDTEITIRTEGGGYDYDVYWEDVTDSNSNGTLNGNTGDLTIDFTVPGTYRVEISRDFPRILFSASDDPEKILSVEQWGDIEWESMASAFFMTKNLVVNASDAPNLSSVLSMSNMFNGAESLNSDLSGWDVSGVTDMRGMFSGATIFNENIDNWNVSTVSNMNNMFASAEAFNRDISGWDVSNVESMISMFRNAMSFNQDINYDSDTGEGWDVSNVEELEEMFDGASAFNQSLGGWTLSANLIDMDAMLDDSGLSTENYDNTLIGWADFVTTNSGPQDIQLGAKGLEYCDGKQARLELIDNFGWEIENDSEQAGCGELTASDSAILANFIDGYEFTGEDFGQADPAASVKIISLPGQSTLRGNGTSVSENDQFTIADINSGNLIVTPGEGFHGYNFDSFEFSIISPTGTESSETYTMTVHAAAGSVMIGSLSTGATEGWRFLTSPAIGDSYDSFLAPLTIDGIPGSANPGAGFPTLYELEQANYRWLPVSGMTNATERGSGFIVKVQPVDVGKNIILTAKNDFASLDDEFAYSGLFYDTNQGPEGDSHFLIANPHPISIDFCEMFNSASTNIAGSVDVWDPEANGGNGDYLNINCGAGDVHIAPFQAYWVRTTDNNPSLSIPEDAYLESMADGYFKENSKIPSENFIVRLNVSSQDQLFSNRVNILFSDEGTDGMDRFDAPKLSAAGLADQWIAFYSIDKNGKAYAFRSLPQIEGEKIKIPLDIQTTESGRFILDWTLPEAHIFNASYFLRDNRIGDVIELKEGNTYSFEIDVAQTSKVSKTLEVFGETAHPMSETAKDEFAALNTHRMNSEGTPRFELLVAISEVDGLTELGATPEDFTLAQNYPNPFNPTTVISYQLPVNSDVRLDVYDMLGRNVATLVDGQVSAGWHTVNFDAGNLSSGIYLYRLQAGSQIMTRKLTVVK